MGRDMTHKERREWFKFVSIKGRYEKSVKINAEITNYEYYEYYEPREVTGSPPKFSNGKVLIDGYYRLRTDSEYYPICGKYGIPDDERSNLAKDFWEHRIASIEIARSTIYWKNYYAEEKRKKIKAAHDLKTARNLTKSEIAGRLGIPVSMASDELIEMKRNQIAAYRAIKQIKKATNENDNNETKRRN